MNETITPTYDDLLPSDLATLEAAQSHHTLAMWYCRLNSHSSSWPPELAPCESDSVEQTHENWKATTPDRRDDIMEWIKNKVGSKYLLMVWQCELMLQGVAPGISKSESDFERWWNEPYPGKICLTKGENHLRLEEWWAKTREEWRADRKARLAQKR